MPRHIKTLRAFLQDEGGATLIEYTLAVGCIALGIIIGLGQVGKGVGQLFVRLASAW